MRTWCEVRNFAWHRTQKNQSPNTSTVRSNQWNERQIL